MNRNEYTVANKRSGTMTISTEPSDLTMYLSPYLTEFERRFFVDNMEVRSIEFTSGGNAQIFCRCMIHDPSRSAENQMLPSKFPRGSETVLCVHAFNKLTTSWAWIKLATTLFRQGFNVILMDLPGFGRSSVGRNIRCSIEQWRRWDVQIFSAFLVELKIPRVNMIGCYDSASVFLQILLNAPQILSKNHFLHNPLFTADELATPRISRILKALLAGGLKRRIFATFDRSRYPDPLSKGELSLSHETVQTLLASEQMLRMVGKTVGFNQVTISPVSSSDLAEICWYEALDQPGIRPIFAFYPSKKFRLYLCQYLSSEEMPPFTGSLASDPKSSENDKEQQPTSDNTQLATVDPTASSTNQFSYGVRVRQMEEQLAMEYALRQSEAAYVESFGEENLLNQQALSDGLATQLTSTVKATKVYGAALEPTLVQRLIRVQAEIEQEAETRITEALQEKEA